MLTDNQTQLYKDWRRAFPNLPPAVCLAHARMGSLKPHSMPRPVSYWRCADGLYSVENPRDGLRFVELADRIISLRHTGWYADEHGDVTYRGVVYQLPARGGCEVFAFGYQDTDNGDTLAILESQTTDDKRDAAIRADDCAQRAAEYAKEYSAAWDAGRRYADSREESTAARAGIRELIPELRKARAEDSATLRKVLTRDIVKLSTELEQQRQFRAGLKAGEGETCGRDQYAMFYPGDKNLRAAFNDGAGRVVLP